MEEASYNCAYFYAETAGKVAGRMSTTRFIESKLEFMKDVYHMIH
jgi:hypothetical protein